MPTPSAAVTHKLCTDLPFVHFLFLGTCGNNTYDAVLKQ